MSRSGRADQIILAHRRRAYWTQNGRCFWCDELMFWSHEKRAQQFPNRKVSADHLIPRKYKRQHQDIDAVWNIVAACYGCNHERGDMPADQWILKIRERIRPEHFVAVLQKLATFGISVVIGQPEQSAPIAVTPDCPPPKAKAPAP